MLTGDVSYVPGARTAVAGDQCLALVEAPADSPAVGRIWQRLGQGATAGELLAALVADGLGDTPGFALLAAAADGQPRLFCRGQVGATVVCDTAPVGAMAGPGPGDGAATVLRIDGSGLLTWREHVVPAEAERIFLGEPPTDAELRLPAAAGVLLAGCVIIDLTNIAARDTLPYLAAVPAGAVGQDAAGRDAAGRDAAGRDAAGPGTAGLDAVLANAVLAETVADPRGTARPGGKQKTIVFFPDTITITHPGSAAGPAPDRYQEVPSSARPWPPSADPARPGGAPPTAPFTGASPPSGPIPSGAAPAPGTMARPAWPAAGQAPGPGAQGGLIDVPPWLAGPGGPAAGAGMPQREGGPDEPGSTVKRAELADVVARTTPPDRIGPVVPALICPGGHVNPPSGGACRRCGAPLPHDAVLVPRPVLGVLRLSLGDVIALDRGVVMGRSPRTDFAGLDGEERPHVVKLPSADGDISRTHLRITLDGWHVLVTDLNSTNGTVLTLPGHGPQQLRPGEPVPMQPGTVVTLAEGIDFRYEVAE
jgi:FHA domain